jgi:phage tail sheath protein FI
MADRDTAVAWATNVSQYIDITLGASAEDPRVAAATGLAGGLDDQAGITDAHWLTALNRFTKALGPGQVSFPGRSAGTAHADLLVHAVANNRVAVLDSSDTNVVATIKAHSTALRLLGSPAGLNPRFAAVFAPWLKVPGITPGTTRTIPPSGTVAGMIARLDGQTGNPNLAAAGIRGASQFALETKYSFTDAERDDLNANGVDILRNMYGEVRLYGYRTAVEPLTQPNWTNFANSRLIMAVAAKADQIAERYVFAQLDGRMLKVNEYGGDLRSMLAAYWDLGALFGATAEEAFNVDVGVQVNTPITMAANELHAVLALRCSPFAERVIVELVKVATTEAVA